jgi:hypothetical protein
MPHVYALSAPFLGAAALGAPAGAPNVRLMRPAAPAWWTTPCACSPTMDPVIGRDGVVYRNTCTASCRGVEVQTSAGGFAGVLGDASTETIRVIGLSAVGLALGYAAAYVLFFRR